MSLEGASKTSMCVVITVVTLVRDFAVPTAHDCSGSPPLPMAYSAHRSSAPSCPRSPSAVVCVQLGVSHG